MLVLSDLMNPMGEKGQLLRWSDIFFVLVVQKKEKEKVANLPNSLE